MADKKVKEPLLTIKGLKTFFPVKGGFLGKTQSYVQAVNDINLTIYKGETLGLVGESGCGKTTLGKTILQLYKPTEGEMVYQFENGPRHLEHLNGKDMDEARRKIQIVFQDPQSSLNPSFTIYQSLSDPLKKFGIKTKEERRKVIGDLLEAVNMRREYMDRYPHEFSGGQQQRVGIARALAVKPEFIVCDEPISALDVSIQSQVVNMLEDMQQDMGLTYLFIAHDLSVVRHISNRIGVMYLGCLVELGESYELNRNPIHPYTKTLLSAVPVPDPEKSRNRQRIMLEGDIPSPINPPSGCRFHTRCPYATERCSQEMPQFKEHEPGHWAACHLLD